MLAFEPFVRIKSTKYIIKKLNNRGCSKETEMIDISLKINYYDLININ